VCDLIMGYLVALVWLRAGLWAFRGRYKSDGLARRPDSNRPQRFFGLALV
jgi:hypothetical protein